MLIQFNFKNYKSFRDEAILDLSAAKMTEFSDRVVIIGSEKILPVAAIYGANASGKSNVYSAFEYMSGYVVNSFKYGDEEEKYVGMECTLYESHDNLEEKVSQCGSLKDEKQTPKTLSELLTDTEFKVDNFSCTSNNIKNSNLYISINVLDTKGKITTYKVPLELTGTCN